VPIRGHVTGHVAGVVVSDEEAAPAGPTETLWSLTGPSQVAEGDDAVYTVSYTGLALDGGETAQITVVTAALDGGFPAADFPTDASGLLDAFTFTGGGATAKTIAVSVVDDTEVEGTEDFAVLMGDATVGSIVVSQVNTIIADDDASNLQWSITGPTSIDEGDSGTYTVGYTGVTLAPGQEATIVAATATGALTWTDATAGSDYTALSTTLTFTGGGATEKTVAVSTIDDTDVEGTEDFRVTIGGQSIGALATSQANTIIVDDDGASLTLTYVGSTTYADAAGDGTVDLPTGTLEGDLLVYYGDVSAGAGTPTDSTPADWAAGPNASQAGLRTKIMAGVAKAGDISAGEIQGLQSSGTQTAILLAFRPSAAIAAIAWFDTSAPAYTNADPSGQTVNASGGAAPLLVLAGYRSSATIDPRGWTGSTPGAVFADVRRYLLYGIFDSSPADITVDMDDEGNNNQLMSGWLEVA
jgi:hypothetical protein